MPMWGKNGIWWGPMSLWRVRWRNRNHLFVAIWRVRIRLARRSS